MIRSLIGRGLAALAALSGAFVSPAIAANISVKDGAGTTQTMCTAVQSDSSQAYCFVYHNAAGAQEDLATKALQTTGNASLATLAGTVAAAGSPAASAQTVQAAALPLPAGAATSANQAPLTVPGTVGASGSTVTSVLPQITAVAGSAISFGTTAATLFGANTARHFMVIQVQGAPDTTGSVGCYINGIAGATADANSLFIARGGYYESATHVGTGAISIICTATMAVYSRQG